MEEKERYELFGEFGIIHDTSPNAECMLLNKFQTCEILNKQDKENQQLKQQLHDLPKKIVEEIRDDMSKRIIEKQIKWGDNIQIGFICNAINECLDTILKKYGGKMSKDSQYYSKIALKYIRQKQAEGELHYNMVSYGNLNLMEDLFDLFGGDRDYIKKHPDWSWGHWHRYRFQFVMNKLDAESKKPDAIFKKGYICYNGIINRPTRCFELKEFKNVKN